MEHEYYTGLSLAILVIFAVKKFGPQMRAWIKKETEVTFFNSVQCTPIQGHIYEVITAGFRQRKYLPVLKSILTQLSQSDGPQIVYLLFSDHCYQS